MTAARLLSFFLSSIVGSASMIRERDVTLEQRFRLGERQFLALVLGIVVIVKANPGNIIL
jgi:hypothetical protein